MKTKTVTIGRRAVVLYSKDGELWVSDPRQVNLQLERLERVKLNLTKSFGEQEFRDL